MRKFFLYPFAALFTGLAAVPAMAADFSDPTWPCVQRKVPHLSIGLMWAGPPVPEDRSLPERAEPLAAALAVRRTSIEDAEALIASYAKELGEDRNAQLALLFGEVFERIERERSEIISGIARYAGHQTGLAKKIDDAQQKVAVLETKGDEKSNDEWDRMEELQDMVTWDARIYRERAQSLTYVCETPVLLEKRAFAIARAIMNELN